MIRSSMLGVVVLAAGRALAVGDIDPHAGMLRFPDVSATHIAFVYGNDIWTVSRGGGEARALASPPGAEAFPRFSPDGRTIAFVGNYEGDRDIYTIPAAGGIATRITHHPANELLNGWTPDGRILFASNAQAGLARQQQLFVVGAEGGLPERLPVPYGVMADISPDGAWLAYTPESREFRTWKRYRGGLATDIWLFNLETFESRQVTDWEGTDSIPMWHGTTVYYLSDDGPEERLNIWALDTATDRRRQITKFDEFDVKFPSIGPGAEGGGEIVFQNGADLYLLDLASGEERAVDVSIPGERPRLRPKLVDAGAFIQGGAASSTGKRAVLEARGDIWTVPAETGAARNLTRTNGAAERDPAWSPSGRWIAYFSDASGEYELYVRQSDGRDEARKLTDSKGAYYSMLGFSPDSKHVAYADQSARLLVTTIETGETRVLDTDPWASAPAISWAHDSKWIAYTRSEERSVGSAIWVYDLERGESHRLTSGMFSEGSPAFDRKGEWLYYTASMDFANPLYEDVGSTFVYAGVTRIMAVPLHAEVENPFLKTPDEEEWEDEADEDDSDAAGDGEESDAADDADADDTEEDADADDDADGADEVDADDEESESAIDRVDTEHPLYGVWESEAKGLSQVGLPEDTLTYSMTLLPLKDGTIIGVSKTQGEEQQYDSVEWDGTTLTLSSSSNGITIVSKATLAGGQLTATWSIEALGVSGTWKATKSDAEPDLKWVEEAEAGGGEDKPLKIDLEGFESRAMLLPIARGRYGGLSVNDSGELLFMSMPVGEGAPPTLRIFDITDDEPEVKTVVAGVGGYSMSGDGKKLLVFGVGGGAMIDAKAGQSLGEGLRTADLDVRIDPREEWRQILLDAWRRHRDFFYVENMHGVDWDAVYDHYAAMLDDAVSREDVSYIIGEMIGELNVGHAYYWGGDGDSQPDRGVGMLGADYELAGDGEQQAYRIARIIEGGAWDADARGPLSQHGVDVKVGDYLLAVNGVNVDTTRDPWAAFLGLNGQTVTITVSDKPVLDDDARDVTISPIADETSLRFRAWIEHNRRYVEEASSGRIGYIYVPNTGVDGQNELFRQFYGQAGKDALIIDERWNGGGQIPNRFIELLNRPRTNYWARRHGKDWPWPYDSHQGPKAMLINGAAGSGGDMFPWLFKNAGLGPLIGTRTWGGLVGISGVPPLIDGGYTAVPNFGFYEKDGTWGIEGHGVDPDIRVIDDPTKLARGVDPQLDAAIEHLEQEVRRNGYTPPRRPADPVRTGIGIRDQDR